MQEVAWDPARKGGAGGAWLLPEESSQYLGFFAHIGWQMSP